MPGSAGVVLAGGLSSRMGSPKAALEWHGSTLLRRTAGLLARFGPVVVVRAAGQQLPALPPSVLVVADPRPGKGPLQGIAAGLTALACLAEAAFVCATDLPFLHPVLVRRMLAEVTGPAGADVGLPLARGYPQPLAAAYRTALAPLADRLVAQDLLRPGHLFERCAVRRIDDAALLADPAIAALDPDLDSLLNVNDQPSYRAARARPAPQVAVRRPDAQEAEPVLVRAATVGQAAAAAGVVLGRRIAATVNGGHATSDEQTPLAPGDTVCFLADQV